MTTTTETKIKGGSWLFEEQPGEVFTPERAKSLAERAGVPEDECYGLMHENAEAGFHWTGQDFKIIRCNNVGKLKK